MTTLNEEEKHLFFVATESSAAWMRETHVIIVNHPAATAAARQ